MATTATPNGVPGQHSMIEGSQVTRILTKKNVQEIFGKKDGGERDTGHHPG